MYEYECINFYCHVLPYLFIVGPLGLVIKKKTKKQTNKTTLILRTLLFVTHLFGLCKVLSVTPAWVLITCRYLSIQPI